MLVVGTQTTRGPYHGVVETTKKAPSSWTTSYLSPPPAPSANGPCPRRRPAAPNWSLHSAPPRHLWLRPGGLGTVASAKLAGAGEALTRQASPLPPGVTALQRPQTFRELVTSLYGHSVSFRGLVRILDLLGCGVGAATLWRDVQAVAPGGCPTRRRPCRRGARWTKPGCPSTAKSVPCPWFWASRANGWTGA